MGREFTPPSGYSHVVWRGLPQTVLAFSSGCHRSVLPLGSWLGWAEGDGTGQGKTVGEEMSSL